MSPSVQQILIQQVFLEQKELFNDKKEDPDSQTVRIFF